MSPELEADGSDFRGSPEAPTQCGADDLHSESPNGVRSPTCPFSLAFGRLDQPAVQQVLVNGSPLGAGCSAFPLARADEVID
jgi:hypothetical protein